VSASAQGPSSDGRGKTRGFPPSDLALRPLPTQEPPRPAASRNARVSFKIDRSGEPTRVGFAEPAELVEAFHREVAAAHAGHPPPTDWAATVLDPGPGGVFRMFGLTMGFDDAAAFLAEQLDGPYTVADLAVEHARISAAGDLAYVLATCRETYSIRDSAAGTHGVAQTGPRDERATYSWVLRSGPDGRFRAVHVSRDSVGGTAAGARPGPPGASGHAAFLSWDDADPGDSPGDHPAAAGKGAAFATPGGHAAFLSWDDADPGDSPGDHPAAAGKGAGGGGAKRGAWPGLESLGLGGGSAPGNHGHGVLESGDHIDM